MSNDNNQLAMCMHKSVHKYEWQSTSTWDKYFNTIDFPSFPQGSREIQIEPKQRAYKYFSSHWLIVSRWKWQLKNDNLTYGRNTMDLQTATLTEISDDEFIVDLMGFLLFRNCNSPLLESVSKGVGIISRLVLHDILLLLQIQSMVRRRHVLDVDLLGGLTALIDRRPSPAGTELMGRRRSQLVRVVDIWRRSCCRRRWWRRQSQVSTGTTGQRLLRNKRGHLVLVVGIVGRYEVYVGTTRHPSSDGVPWENISLSGTVRDNHGNIVVGRYILVQVYRCRFQLTRGQHHVRRQWHQNVASQWLPSTAVVMVLLLLSLNGLQVSWNLCSLLNIIYLVMDGKRVWLYIWVNHNVFSQSWSCY